MMLSLGTFLLFAFSMRSFVRPQQSSCDNPCLDSDCPSVNGVQLICDQTNFCCARPTTTSSSSSTSTSTSTSTTTSTTTPSSTTPSTTTKSCTDEAGTVPCSFYRTRCAMFANWLRKHCQSTCNFC